VWQAVALQQLNHVVAVTPTPNGPLQPRGYVVTADYPQAQLMQLPKLRPVGPAPVAFPPVGGWGAWQARAFAPPDAAALFAAFRLPLLPVGPGPVRFPLVGRWDAGVILRPEADRTAWLTSWFRVPLAAVGPRPVAFPALPVAYPVPPPSPTLWQRLVLAAITAGVAPPPPPPSVLVQLLGLPLWAIQRWPPVKPPVPYYVEQPPPPVVIPRAQRLGHRVETAPLAVLMQAVERILRTPERRPVQAPRLLVRRRIPAPLPPIIFAVSPVPVAPPAKPALVPLPTRDQLPALPDLPRPVTTVVTAALTQLDRSHRRAARHAKRRMMLTVLREVQEAHWAALAWLLEE